MSLNGHPFVVGGNCQLFPVKGHEGPGLGCVGVDGVAPAVLLHRRDQFAAASRHDRGARRPIRVTVQVERHGLIFPAMRGTMLPVSLSARTGHAEAIIGLRLSVKRTGVRRTVAARVRETAPWPVRIAGREVNTGPVGRERVPHPTPDVSVAGGIAGSEELEPGRVPGVHVDRNDPSLLYRIVTGVVDST